jgi:hypothetical protein
MFEMPPIPRKTWGFVGRAPAYPPSSSGDTILNSSLEDSDLVQSAFSLDRNGRSRWAGIRTSASALTVVASERKRYAQNSNRHLAASSGDEAWAAGTMRAGPSSRCSARLRTACKTSTLGMALVDSKAEIGL